ncbi:MAG: AAA family ATPase [Sulfurovum sp.]|nr:AAA family ATPase [Sulfurovum sp.]MCB4748640.1 AAA family ATPase [Sulfurovum sp.]MCB4750816.1 AAA family ATPase [Sulfurovum sp.]MCB4754888.1 AAA family ATPase [Sulfurovum sp.]MCB4758543.1 AAA family ATPase [Sulfurovum sp.]
MQKGNENEADTPNNCIANDVKLMIDKTDVLEALKHNNTFLTGGAGVGKSYITNEIIDDYRKHDKQVVSLGSTGVSAVNIGGFTVHSFFVFGIASNFEELAEHDKRTKKRLGDLKKALKATDLIIIDEISMVSAELLDMIAYRLNTYGYLGKVLFVGDFFQLPPVQKQHNPHDVFGEKLYAFESLAWERFDLTVIELTEMKRTQDAELTHILSKVRQGICDDEVLQYMHCLWNNEGLKPDPTYLFGRNAEVELTNRARINELKSEETILFADIEMFGSVHEKKLEGWKKLLPISEQLTLKEGVPILFTVNKWGKFVNGERGILRTIEDNHLIVEKENTYVRVERHDFDLLDMVVKEDGTLEQVSLATLSQFPLKLAYAVTIHKSQGMSIDNLVCNVDNIFAPSQFYVAISRAINPRYLKIDFNRGNLMHYLKQVIHVDKRVTEYYKKQH